MGSGIATALVLNGLDVILKEVRHLRLLTLPVHIKKTIPPPIHAPLGTGEPQSPAWARPHLLPPPPPRCFALHRSTSSSWTGA